MASVGPATATVSAIGPAPLRFVLYALDGPLGLSGAPRIGEIQAAINGHVIAEATLVGTYQR